MPVQDYAIICTDESSLLLSNKRSLEFWNVLSDLVQILSKEGNLESERMLFAWRNDGPRRAAAREPYAWRAVIEEIKNTDLSSKCKEVVKDREILTLMTDKPTMLKIAGEITNSLIHSYTIGHRISFVLV